MPDLKEYQFWSGLLYTDAQIRNWFIADPEQLVQQKNISKDLLHSLQQHISVEELKLFSWSLIRKRARAVQSAYPSLCQLSISFYNEKFEEYAQRNPIQGKQKKHSIDAQKFGRWLLRQPLSIDQKQAVRFDLAQLLLQEKTFFFRVVKNKSNYIFVAFFDYKKVVKL